MKIGVITDIHANYLALEAVIDALKKEQCEQWICAGDFIGIGPRPEEVLRRVRQLPNLTAVCGNHELYLRQGLPSQVPNEEGMGEEEIEGQRWQQRQLSAESVDFINQLPKKAMLEVEGKKIMVLHYAMDQEQRYLPIEESSRMRLLALSEQADVIVYGHDHCRSIRCIHGRWLVCCGSLGCPASEKDVARAGIIEITRESGVHVKALDIRYNVKQVLKDIDALAYPSAGEIKQFFYGVNPR